MVVHGEATQKGRAQSEAPNKFGTEPQLKRSRVLRALAPAEAENSPTSGPPEEEEDWAERQGSAPEENALNLGLVSPARAGEEDKGRVRP